MSTLDAAKQPDSQAFDDLLGQLVDELAMSPAAIPQPDPAPQVIPAPAPVAHGAMYSESIDPTSSRTGSTKTTIAVVGIISGAVVALGVAAMLILPGGSDTAPAQPAPVAASPLTSSAAIPAPSAEPPPAPPSVEAAAVVPPPADEKDEPPVVERPEETKSTPAPKKRPPTKKPPKKKPPKKKPPKDDFEDL